MNYAEPNQRPAGAEPVVDQQRLDDESLRVKAAYERRSPVVDAQRYTYFSKANLLSIQNLERAILRLLERSKITSLRSLQLLEVGCGDGFWLRQFIQWGASPENLTGLDLLDDRIANARLRCPAQVKLFSASAAQLAFPDASFDVVLQSTVFSSIHDREVRHQVAEEMLRVLRPGGFVLWYDLRMDNPRNPDVYGIPRAEIGRIFPNCRVELRRITLAPPLARMLAPRSRLLCQLLAAVPPLCTHFLGTIRKP